MWVQPDHSKRPRHVFLGMRFAKISTAVWNKVIMESQKQQEKIGWIIG